MGERPPAPHVEGLLSRLRARLWPFGSPDAAPTTRETEFQRRLRELEQQLEELRESEEQFRDLVENARDVIVETDLEGHIRYANPQLKGLHGYSLADLEGKSAFDLVHPDDRESLRESFLQLVATDESTKPVYRILARDGGWRWVESSGRIMTKRDGERRVLVISREIGGRRQLEQALRRSEARYQTLIESVHDLVFETDARGRVLYVSPSLRDVLGYDPARAAGSDVLAGMHHEDVAAVREVFRKTLASREPARAEVRYRHLDGSWRWMEAKGRAIEAPDGDLRWVLIARDVTERVRAEQERRQLEAQVQQSQKLESLGVLAGGIAHDFNNLLTSILGYADLAGRELERDSTARASVEQIRQAAQRAADLTRQLLAYAGRGRIAMESLDLSRLVESMVQLLKISVSKKAALEWSLAPALPPVHGDSGRISQVVLNLITNASDSLEEKGGSIRISTGVANVDRAYLSRAYVRDELPEGRYVYVEVHDTGVGMNEETKTRIFDPFFTTKFRGRGLGLAAVLGIVRAHGAAIVVESEPGRGSTFRVLFPCAAEGSAWPSAPQRPAERLRGRGTVLVIDDEPDVRSIASRMLSVMGFTVLSADDGKQGVETFRAQPEAITLVLLDLTMPRMDGEEALKELRQIRSAVPVVFMSGYAEDEEVSRADGQSLVGFLQKPFTMEDLQAALRSVMPAATR
jgi:PAS domain S-box-containing protein